MSENPKILPRGCFFYYLGTPHIFSACNDEKFDRPMNNPRSDPLLWRRWGRSHAAIFATLLIASTVFMKSSFMMSSPVPSDAPKEALPNADDIMFLITPDIDARGAESTRPSDRSLASVNLLTKKQPFYSPTNATNPPQSFQWIRHRLRAILIRTHIWNWISS